LGDASEWLVFYTDGVKTKKAMNYYSALNSLHYNFKGHGATHQVTVDVQGRIMMVETFQGAPNDRQNWKASELFLNYFKYMRPGDTGLGDGVYSGEVARGARGRCAQSGIDAARADFIIPANKAQVATNPALKAQNHFQRYLRCVVEHVIGRIKEWKISMAEYRGSVVDQETVFTVSARLTAWVMEQRDTYPRGNKFLAKKLEEWEVELGKSLYMEKEEELEELRLLMMN
jgi:hypothetical protein